MLDLKQILTKTLTTQKYEWQDDSACKGIDINVFFPDFRGMSIDNYIKNNIPCHKCPVKTECLEHAVEHEEQGIWGGVYLRPPTMTVRVKKTDGK
jgi:WhiB family redox-sensing transcriptional regulator